jgi:glyoxylase-like metal-dependent hydrolase (beta-lactamase superfamily II)
VSERARPPLLPLFAPRCQTARGSPPDRVPATRLDRLTDQITQVTRLGSINAYLVREDEGLTLVDTMLRGSAAGLRSAADGLGAPIRRIAVTHGHGDHVGSLDQLREALGEGVEVLAPARDARIMAGDKSLDPGEGNRRLRGSWPRVTTRPDVLLQPSDRVGSLEVVASPGHTPGHVAFLDTRDRSLICGDACQTLGGTTVSGKLNWRFPFPAMATWDPELSLVSARELRGLDPTLLAPGHGRGLRDPQAEMDAAIARAAS